MPTKIPYIPILRSGSEGALQARTSLQNKIQYMNTISCTIKRNYVFQGKFIAKHTFAKIPPPQNLEYKGESSETTELRLRTEAICIYLQTCSTCHMMGIQHMPMD